MNQQLRTLCCGLLALFAGIGCGQGGQAPAAGQAKPAAKASEVKGTVLAKVGNEVITKEDFEDRLNKLNPYIRQRYASLERKKEYLDILIRTEVLAQEASRLGYDQDPQIKDRIKNELAQKLINKEFDEKKKQSLVSDAEVQKYYEEHQSDYNKPEAVRVAHIFKAVPADAAAKKPQIKAEAEKLLAQLKKAPDDKMMFADLARKHSDDKASKTLGGDLNYMDKAEMAGKYGDAFATAAFGLQKTGEISGVIEGKEGFHILAMRGRRPAINRPFDQVKNPIRSRLYYDKRQKALDDWVASLRNQQGVKIEEEALKNVRIELQDAGSETPPGATNAAFATPPQAPPAGAGGDKPGPDGK